MLGYSGNMAFEYQGDSIVEERLAWHEAEEVRLRQLADDCLRQASEHAAKASAFRLVREDISLAFNGLRGEEKRSTVTDLPVAPIANIGEGKPFIEWVREAVVRQPDTFDLTSVRKTLDEIAPGLSEKLSDRSALSKTLSRMAETGEVSVIRKGQGKRPAIYRQGRRSLVTLARLVAFGADRTKEEAYDNSGQVSDRDPISG